MEKLVEVGILFDFYGKLLSNKQYQVVELYYIYDLSLTEIGEETNITRQGVYDTLKRSEQKLYHYEDTLGLIGKFNKIEDSLRNIIDIANELEGFGKKNSIDSVYQNALKIKDIGNKIID
ncbi:MAG: sigma factor-like helix-turn-helix DNA-binding protein [Tissierellia bacterium]|nr:sigma factor-like helix-turn-helix DNA-binding protein [Tissierellia bacterium]MDD4725611.1 sigma factor-like helix-turn-helix DNA-binding protein [Tissierellia bacterium]